ncbi:hypothetical protein MTR67_044237 [Solanum verrucosum]|uniref:K+ potassium transporter integral membrane domain-containing protein n=1 Tax=Solanum verrucosum TaxID=315347 RepID=A0AAF0ZSS1_SOLVR|nr:hypothetical protein MTR67_044237 [Solanum verrucosum]
MRCKICLRQASQRTHFRVQLCTIHGFVTPVVHFNRKEVDVAFELPIIRRYEIESQELQRQFISVLKRLLLESSSVGFLKDGAAKGSEAMFADLCYFSVRSVQLTFVFLVLPCLLLGYLGQAAYLMENHADTTQAFFSSVPSGVFWPVFLIANVAALIASRAMTTATFSCIKQSTALGCFPRLKIIHTSRKFMGQIYIPVMNWFLLALSLVMVCSISSIYEIGNAYGNAWFLVH